MRDTDKLDLLVFGTGPAASTVAMRCAKAGWQVGVVDPKPFGGTCALHGCNPKKVLVRAAEATDQARRMHGKGVRSEGVRIDWPELIRFKKTFTDPVTESKEKSLSEAGIQAFHDAPRFSGPNRVEIGGRTVEAKHFLIATGAVPVELPITGKEHLTTSDEFLEIEQLPNRVIFVGGGYISFEFAHAAARAGIEVTVLEMTDHPLAAFDEELVDRLVDRSRKIGIDVRIGTKVEQIEKRPDGTLLVSVQHNGTHDSIEAGLVVHGAGRVPNVEGLGLDSAGVEADRKGIRVNEFLQSVSNPAVYAAGDVTNRGAPPLTPVANQEGYTVAKNLLQEEPTKPDYGPVPAAVFSVPALAAVGLTEREARDQNLAFELKRGDWAGFSSMRKVGETHAAYKILVEQESGRFLGAHLLGPEAAELINFFVLAMKFDIKAHELKSALIVFPTLAADLRSMI